MEASVADAPRAARAKTTPMFRVFLENRETGLWENLTPDVPLIAPSRKAARSMALGDKEGRCFAIREAEYDPKTREFKQETETVTKIQETWT